MKSMSSEPSKPAESHRSGLTVARSLGAGAKVALIGGAALASAESFMSVARVWRHYDGTVPLASAAFAALGKAAVTHTLFWLPVMLVCALVGRLCWRRGASPRPEPFLAALFVALAGLVVIPVDLAMVQRDTTFMVWAACAVCVALAVGVYLLMRWAANRLGLGRFRRAVNAVAAVALTLTVVSGIALVSSPEFNAAGHRVAGRAHSGTATDRPHVLWIVLDTTRADRTSLLGERAGLTPFLAEFASKSLVFDWAFSNGMWTGPGHASMFTGLSVREHGVDRGHELLEDRFQTVAQVLSDQGYATAVFTNNPWISPATRLARGFEDYCPVWQLRGLSRFSLQQLCERRGITPPVPWLDPDFGAALTNQLVADWVDRKLEGGRPLFVFVNYMEAHAPYRVPKPFRRMFLTDEQVDRSYDLRRVYQDLVLTMHQRFNIDGPESLRPSDRQVLKGQYQAAVRYLDHRVGEAVGIFEQRGLLDNTLVIVTSDHGEYLDTHGMWAHTFLAYNDLIHVPLLIREPRRQQGRRVNTPVLLSDLYPTVLQTVLGTSEPGPGYGARNLLNLPEADHASRIVVSEYNGPDQTTLSRALASGSEVVAQRTGAQIAAQDGRFKYLRSITGFEELYDLQHDPGELHNLIAEQPDRARRLADYIDQWREAVPKFEISQQLSAPEIDPAAARALQSLGYIGEVSDRPSTPSLPGTPEP